MYGEIAPTGLKVPLVGSCYLPEVVGLHCWCVRDVRGQEVVVNHSD